MGVLWTSFLPKVRTEFMEKTLLDLSREIRSISKTGLAFSENPYDLERFKQLEKIAIEMISGHSQYSKEFLNDVFSAEAGYVTPKLDVRSAVFKENKILMVKEKSTSAWTLPGGYVDVNESISSAAEREVFEESGFQVKAKKIAALYDHRKHGYKPRLYHFHKIYVICDLEGGSAKTNVETSDIAFLSVDEIENIALDPGRITKSHALRMFDHYLQAGLPVDFD